MKRSLPWFSRSALRAFGVAIAATAATACLTTAPPVRPPTLAELRHDAPGSRDPELAAAWLLSELVSPKGDAGTALKARARLDALGTGGMFAAFARGTDDGLHGRLAAASEHYLEAVRAARESNDERAPLVAWLSASRGVALSHDAPALWSRWKDFVVRAIAEPRGIGWRARSELVEWWIDESWAAGAPDVSKHAVLAYGCLTQARLAGPFGRSAAVDAIRRFGPEKAGPWPHRWDPEPGVSRAPRILETKAHSCAIETDEHPGDGIFYVETYFDLTEPREVLVSVQGGLAVLVDDHTVLERDVREWGVWPRFGASIRLAAGRHRLVARLSEPSTSIRVMRPDGTPLGLVGSTDSAPPYAVTPPTTAGEPNLLLRWVKDGRAVDPGDDLTRFLAAELAHLESSDDVASVLVEPLLAKIDLATGPTLSTAAIFAEADPIFDTSQATDLVRELHQRAAKKDPGLWASRLSLALGLAERKGAEEAVPELEKLAREFPGAPDVGLSLARVYGELGWSVEHSRTIRALVESFPEDVAVLRAAVDVFDARGDTATTDALLARIRRLDHDDEVALSRALSREDYTSAIAELERLAKLHPDREELGERIHDAKVRAGHIEEVWRKLEAAVAKEPLNVRARLDLADARFATGEHGALYRAVADGVVAGANPSLLTNAIDLVEGVTELEPYRLDARQIIDAYEQSGREMQGTAARLVDYAALWVRADGSSRMLEHEIIRLQSAEAISTFAEHRALDGLVLHMRVIKKDGRMLEPEFVAGKPTVTFPHLEVGDYIETEQVLFSPGDGRGASYVGPRWFFREENVAYARSEFVVISPESKELVVETTGSVPPPVIEAKDGVVTRRWRVDASPAAPAEPSSAPLSEFLPSVHAGWGVSLERRLQGLGDAMTQLTPVDPRIRRIAEHVTGSLPASDAVGRARRLYRWLLDNVEPGEEADGRRIVIGKRGNLWQGFRMLCRAAGVPVRYAVARSRLAAPPKGPLSGATMFAQPVAKIEGKRGTAWLTLGNKYAPFGYLPADVRGMPAKILDGDVHEDVTVPEQGSADAIAFSGHGKLDTGGALAIDLVLEFSGKLAMGLRRGLSQVPEQELHGVLESNLLAQTLRGGELKQFTIEHRDDFDASLRIRMKVAVSHFAQVSGKTLVVAPPLSPDLGRLATLPSRQTPLLVGEALHRNVALEIELPARSTVDGLVPGAIADADRKVTVTDSVKNSVLRLTRTVDIPAGRIQPPDYPRFARFAQQADDALSRVIQVKLP